MHIGEGRIERTVPIAFSSYAGMDVGHDNGLVVDRPQGQGALRLDRNGQTGGLRPAATTARGGEGMHQYTAHHAVAAGSPTESRKGVSAPAIWLPRLRAGRGVLHPFGCQQGVSNRTVRAYVEQDGKSLDLLADLVRRGVGRGAIGSCLRVSLGWHARGQGFKSPQLHPSRHGVPAVQRGWCPSSDRSASLTPKGHVSAIP
jgi:hypothetical protein